MRVFVCTFLVCLVASATFVAAAEPSTPKVTLREADWDGVLQAVKQHRGRIVLVDVWTTTCETCVSEFPEFVALQKRFGNDVTLVSVCCDYDGIAGKPPAFYRDEVVRFLEKQRATFDNVLLSVPFIDFLDSVDLASTPAVYVFGPDGKLAKRFDNDDAETIEDEFDMADVASFVTDLRRRTNPRRGANSAR